MNDDLFVCPGRIHHWVSANSPDHRLGHNQKRRDLDAGKVNRRLQPLYILHGSGGIDIHKDADVWGGKCALDHCGGNCLAHTLDRYALLALARLLRGCQVLEDRGLGGRPNNIFAGDLAMHSGAGHIRQINAQILGKLANRWLCHNSI